MFGTPVFKPEEVRGRVVKVGGIPDWLVWAVGAIIAYALVT